MRLADQNAALSRDETQAQICRLDHGRACVGLRPLTAVSQAVVDPTIDPPWLFSIAIEDTAYVELVAVRVLVEQQLEAQLQPARFELVRWLPNPDYIPPAEHGASRRSRLIVGSTAREDSNEAFAAAASRCSS